jgi:hypothetical protein
MVSFDFKRFFFLMENKDFPHMWKNPSHKKGLPKVLLTWGEKVKEERPKEGVKRRKKSTR